MGKKSTSLDQASVDTQEDSGQTNRRNCLNAVTTDTVRHGNTAHIHKIDIQKISSQMSDYKNICKNDMQKMQIIIQIIHELLLTSLKI